MMFILQRFSMCCFLLQIIQDSEISSIQPTPSKAPINWISLWKIGFDFKHMSPASCKVASDELNLVTFLHHDILSKVIIASRGEQLVSRLHARCGSVISTLTPAVSAEPTLPSPNSHQSVLPQHAGECVWFSMCDFLTTTRSTAWDSTHFQKPGADNVQAYPKTCLQQATRIVISQIRAATCCVARPGLIKI